MNLLEAEPFVKRKRPSFLLVVMDDWPVFHVPLNVHLEGSALLALASDEQSYNERLADASNPFHIIIIISHRNY